MAGVKIGKRNVNEKKEHSQDRRKRLERDRRAKETAQKVVIPAMLAVLALLVVFFFYKYGFGGVRNAISK